MIQMVLRLVAHPGRTAAMIEALRTLMLPLPAERGFVSCHLYTEAGVPDLLCYVEEWQGQECLDQQIRSRRWTQLLALMDEAVEPPDVQLHWSSDVRGLDYVEAVRRVAR